MVGAASAPSRCLSSESWHGPPRASTRQFLGPNRATNVIPLSRLPLWVLENAGPRPPRDWRMQEVAALTCPRPRAPASDGGDGGVPARVAAAD
eukprot:9391407-Pyramimonas_sp.AAC.1